MSTPDPTPPSLDDIEARLAAIRRRRAPPKRGGARMQGTELAWRMVIDLTVGMAVGLAIGWGLDGLLGTRPFLMIVFVLLGFAAGVRLMLQSATDAQRRRTAGDAPAATEAGPTAGRDDAAGSGPAEGHEGAGAAAPPKDEGR